MLDESAYLRIGLSFTPLASIKTVQMLGSKVIAGDNEIGMRG
jgi:hypothetical protein